MRIFYLNPHSFRYDNKEKFYQLQQKIKELEIDYCLLSSCDRKQDSRNLNQIKRRFRQINRNVKIILSDSGQYEVIKNNQMLGGTFKVIFSKQIQLVSNKYSHSKGRQSSIKLKTQKKSIILTTIYRLPNNTNKGIYTIKIQLDKASKQVKSASSHRKEFIKNLLNYISNNEQNYDLIIAGDLNESIELNTIQDFMNEYGLIKVHMFVNRIYETR